MARLARRCATALALLAFVTLGACGGDARKAKTAANVRTPAATVAALPWDSVLARARGTTVTWMMWRGDASINAYVDGWVAPRLRDRYGITLNVVSGQGAGILNHLVVEREAGRGAGTTDLLWINGETFANLRTERLLDGPWAGRLPSAAYVDSASPIVSRDFEQDPAGYESPWGRVQLALIYDSARTPQPPRTVAALGAWIRAHPGRFVHDQGFTGITFLKGVMYARAGGVARFQGGFREADYAAGRDAVFAWLDSVRPSFWRAGATYPQGVAELHRLFANGEIDFTMSNNQYEVMAKVRQGTLPPTSRALVLEDGTIANAHFLGIPFNAPNAAGAMVVADFLLSPEAQLQKQRPEVWADGSVLAPERLPAEWRARFETVRGELRALPAETLARYARPEVAPQYHERLQTDWRAHVRTGAR